MNRKQYREHMKAIGEGKKVSQEVFEQLTEFAKKNKAKRPSEDAVKKARKAKAPKEPKAPKEKVACSVTREQDPKMETDACPNLSRAGGMCATHYSRLIYLAQPENAEKAREASKAYAARKRAEKKAAEAEASAA
jgi:hypothetical protein